jgi:hypothetical protein
MVRGLGTLRRVPTVFVTFPVFYMWFMTQRPAQFPRWVYPLAPFVAVAGSAMLWALVDRVQPVLLRVAKGKAAAVRWLLSARALMVLVQPLWRSVVFVKRSLAVPTHTLIEEWLRSHTSAGDRVLVPEGWLDFTGTDLRVNRVPKLGPVLVGGLYPLCYNDWVIVPERDLRLTGALKRLKLVESFFASSSFHGNMGYDFAVYATERLEPSDETVDFALERPEAQPYLGAEWPSPDAGRDGRSLPSKGASIYLPPLRYVPGRLEIELQGAPVRNGQGVAMAPSDPGAAIAVELDDKPLALDQVLREGSRTFWSSVPVAGAAPGRSVTRVRLMPVAPSTTVRVLRFATRR